MKKKDIWFVVVIAVPTIIQFFSNRPIDLDESWIALNLMNRSYGRLLLPLDYNQVAPIGLLMLWKSLGLVFGYKVWALRLYAFLLFVPSLYLIYRFIKHYSDEKTALFTSTLFALNTTVIFLFTETKQYAGDVFFFFLLVILAIRYLNQPGLKNALTLSLTGMLALWFSNVSVFALATIGVVVLFKYFRQKFRLKSFVLIGLSWLVSFGIYYWFFIRNHPTRDFMIQFWTRWNAFFDPLHPVAFIKNFFFVAGKSALELMGPLKYLSLMIFIGIFSLFKQKKFEFLLWTLTPVVLHIFASTLRMYPFQVRMSLYLFPVFILWFLLGLQYFFNLFKPGLFRYASYTILAWFVFNAIKFVPYRGTEFHQVMSRLDFKKPDTHYYFHRNVYFPLRYYQLLGKYPNLQTTYFFNNIDLSQARNGDKIITYFNGKPMYKQTRKHIYENATKLGFKLTDSLHFNEIIIYRIEKQTDND